MKNFIKKSSFFALILVYCSLCFSCVSLSSLFTKQRYTVKISRDIMAPGFFTSYELADFFLKQNPGADEEEVQELAFYYVYEGLQEGVNYTVAFAQMCLETGYLRFGGLVQPEFHNYCGLGAMDKDNPGCQFETMQMGVRAHIQHLQAYATKEDQKLNNPVIDPRYDWVHKTKYIQTIFELTGTWAMDPEYGNKIDSILTAMEDYIQYS